MVNMDENNEWIKKAGQIDWFRLEKMYFRIRRL